MMGRQMFQKSRRLIFLSRIPLRALSSGESCKRTEKLRLESSKGLDDVVLLLPDCLKADGGGGGGGVHGDCHHYQQHQVFQRHRDWLQCNLLVCLLRWSVAVSPC